MRTGLLVCTDAATIRNVVTAQALQLSRPPFAIVNSLGSLEVGLEMVACFEGLGARADRLEHAHTLAVRSIGLTDAVALVPAGRLIAHDIDRGIGAGVAAGYHNGQHYLEVMLTALYLARLSGFDARRTARVVTAGLIHDFHHDGSRGTVAPFRLEMLAVQKALPYLFKAGVSAEDRDALEALVLATEPRAGVPFARACWAHHDSRAAAPPSSSKLPTPLGRLLSAPALAHEAVLLAEADVLPSIGLTFKHAEQLQVRLGAEWGATLGRDDKLQFIDRMVADLSVAAAFVPNVLALRQEYVAAR